MMLRLGFLMVFLLGETFSIENRGNQIKPKQLFYAPESRFTAEILDYNFLNPQQPSLVPQYNFADARNAIPRYQPQFLFYGAGPGQPFLLNPGQTPNNFLFPPPEAPQGPGVIYRNAPQPQPGRPVFGVPGNPAGFPNQKPTFLPPKEKDAEEIPTNPAKIPPFKPKKPVRKPEKIETFDETPSATEADDLEGTQTPQVQPKSSPEAKPGHRYFYLNGQSLFNYPFSLYLPQNVNPEDVLRYSQSYPKTRPQEVPVPVIPALQNPAFQNNQFQTPNFQNPAIFDGLKPDQNRNGFPLNFDPYFQGNLVPQQNLQQPQNQQFQNNLPVNYLQPQVPAVQYNSQQETQQLQQSNSPQRHVYVLKKEPSQAAEITKTDNENKQSSNTLLRSILPLSISPNNGQNVKIKFSSQDFNLQPVRTQEFSQYQDDIENDSVVIDAKFDDGTQEDEVASVPVKQPQEPSLAQAEPGAIALAGPGGVAESGPRATALVGKEGMAVASPKATAIAGPENKEKDEDKKDQNKDKKEKYFRQRFRGSYL